MVEVVWVATWVLGERCGQSMFCSITLEFTTPEETIEGHKMFLNASDEGVLSCRAQVLVRDGRDAYTLLGLSSCWHTTKSIGLHRPNQQSARVQQYQLNQSTKTIKAQSLAQSRCGAASFVTSLPPGQTQGKQTICATPHHNRIAGKQNAQGQRAITYSGCALYLLVLLSCSAIHAA